MSSAHPNFLDFHLALEHRTEVPHTRRDHVETVGGKNCQPGLIESFADAGSVRPRQRRDGALVGIGVQREAVPRLRTHPKRVRPHLRGVAVDAGVKRIGRTAALLPGDGGRQQPAQALFDERNPTRSA